MKAGVYGQYYKSETQSYIEILLKALHDRNIDVVIEKDFYHAINKKNLPLEKYSTFTNYSDLSSDLDFMLTVGGDGTFLRAATYVRDLKIPILGINVGRLGFLATVQKNEIAAAMDKLVNKEYEILKRSLLKIETSKKGQLLTDLNIALNEITVSRRNTTSMITVETWLNGEYLNSYWADGLIVATPTGSTGYSLSCGGPVITPDTQSLVVTPIAPHNLNARPLVIPDSTEITLRVSTREKSVLVSLDSRITTIDPSVTLYISKASYSLKTIQFSDKTFLNTLREKLLWGEDKRN